MACPLCRARRARRACPARQADICTVCCGTKRLVEIACPSTCVYLEAAQRHPAAAVKRQQAEDAAALIESLGPVSERQLELFFLLQTFVLRFQPPDGTPLADADVADAAGAAAASLETAHRGVIYEHQASSPRAEALRRELRGFLAEIVRSAGAHVERDAVAVLRGIERGARHEGASDAGHRSYLTRIARVLKEPPSRSSAGGAIIMP